MEETHCVDNFLFIEEPDDIHLLDIDCWNIGIDAALGCTLTVDIGFNGVDGLAIGLGATHLLIFQGLDGFGIDNCIIYI